MYVANALIFIHIYAPCVTYMISHLYEYVSMCIVIHRLLDNYIRCLYPTIA